MKGISAAAEEHVEQKKENAKGKEKKGATWDERFDLQAAAEERT